MVRYMRLRNTVSSNSTEPCTDRSEVTEQLTIERRKCATWECECGGTVVWQERVGVLQEGDED